MTQPTPPVSRQDEPITTSFAPDSNLVDEIVVSPNIGERRNGAIPSYLILHYTGLETAARSIEVLSDPICEVSCHYLVDFDGRVIQMVAERQRAWHAGKSYWAGETDLNSHSVGIEIQNPGHTAGLPDYPTPQMAAVKSLARDIIQRHNIAAPKVLAHSDIAPQRKIDPGENFDWADLHADGIGHWVPPISFNGDTQPTSKLINGLASGSSDAHAELGYVTQQLAKYGYNIASDAHFDQATVQVIKAFQRHFRPDLINGLPDRSTRSTLDALLAAL